MGANCQIISFHVFFIHAGEAVLRCEKISKKKGEKTRRHKCINREEKSKKSKELCKQACIGPAGVKLVPQATRPCTDTAHSHDSRAAAGRPQDLGRLTTKSGPWTMRSQAQRMGAWKCHPCWCLGPNHPSPRKPRLPRKDSTSSSEPPPQSRARTKKGQRQRQGRTRLGGQHAVMAQPFDVASRMECAKNCRHARVCVCAVKGCQQSHGASQHQINHT